MNKQTAFNALLTILAFGLATIIVQSVPETQALLNSPLATPASFDSLCRHLFPLLHLLPVPL